MSQVAERGHGHRVLGSVGATGVIVASMVGSGIFSLTGQFGASVGSDANLLAPWIIGGLIALCGGLSLAELGAMIPCSGGSVEFARRAFGPLPGYLVAMVTLIAGYMLSISAVALFLAGFVDEVAPGLGPDWVIAVVAILLALASQIAGLRTGFAFNTAFTGVKVLFLLAFIVAGLLASADGRIVPPADAATVLPPSLLSSQVANATLSVSFAYLGWSAGADVAGEIRNPGKTVPRSIIIAIALVTVLYLGTNIVFLKAIAPGAMVEADGSPMKAIGAVAARVLFGHAWGEAMTIAIALLLFSTIVPLVISGARVLESMASAGEVPACLGSRTTAGVPRVGLLVVAGASIAALAIGSLGEILETLTVLITVFSSLSVAAVIVLRRTMPRANRPFRVPLFPVLPLAYLALSAWSVFAGIASGGWTGVVASTIAVALLLGLRLVLTRLPRGAGGAAA